MDKKVYLIVAYVLIMEFTSSDICYAASISAKLSNSDTRVTTTFDSGSSGNHFVRVHGYEYYAYKDKYFLYDVTNTIQGGGSLHVTHASGSSCMFVPVHSGVRLKSYVSFNTKNNVVLSAIPTR